MGPSVHSLDKIHLTVPSLVEARRFFESFGMNVQVSSDRIDLRCFGSDHCWMSLDEGTRKRLTELVFGAYEQDLPAHGARLKRLEVGDLRVEKDGGLSFNDPEGLRLRIVSAPKSSPDAKSCPSNLHSSVPPGDYAAPLRSKASRVFPRRFAHALLFTADVSKAVDFYMAALGLGLSDEAGGIAFLHGLHGSDHHLVGFAQSDGPGLHHSSWDVGSVQEVGAGWAQMSAAGYDRGWGLGRHVLGSNYFRYVRDPWGSYAEYSFDIDYVPAGSKWKSGHHDAEDGFYLWGPSPPEDFTKNYETFQV